MIHENEILMLILAIATLVFSLLYLSKIKRITKWRFLFYAYCFFLIASFSTVIEGFIAPLFFNFLEHISYLIFALLFAIWCFLITRSKNKTVIDE